MKNLSFDLNEFLFTAKIYKATYYNSVLNEQYVLAGVTDLAHAWSLAEYAASRNGWNPIDITKVKLS